MPSIEPGILISVNTKRMSHLLFENPDRLVGVFRLIHSESRFSNCFYWQPS